MKGIAFLSGLISGLLTSGFFLSAVAQVSSDKTTNTTINKNGNKFNITNGIQKGNNLFHSFDKFSIPKGSSAVFKNPNNIVNIINRVTGGNISNIDGLIKASGNANLFLMNPAGIVFSENASLDIGGSFYGTTAESIKFADGLEFSATNTNESPLLSINVPVGLQIGQNSKSIQVRGTGHNLFKNGAFSPYFNLGSTNSLQVKPGYTLALVGADIKVDDGILTAESGRLELVSIREGEIDLIEDLKSFRLGEAKFISNLGDIKLSQKTLIDVSGAGAGSVNLQGNQINLKDDSAVLVQNRGIQPAGDINVRAKSIELSGNTQLGSIFINETLAGDAGNIIIETERLKILDGTAVFSQTFGFGNSGSIDINATESIDIIGVSAVNPEQVSIIGSTTFSEGNAGNIKLSTRNLSVLDSNGISVVGFGGGSSGNIIIDSETVQVAKMRQEIRVIPAISGSAFGTGDAGNITINTQTLSVRDGSNISTTGYNSGGSGSININATKSVEVIGENEIQNSNINSSVLAGLEFDGQLLKFSELITSNAGEVNINTAYLKIGNNANISVVNQGMGDAGKLRVNADLTQLENQGSLLAISNSGGGGNIFVRADSLQLRRNSLISTNSGGERNGGNINIDTNTLVAVENSDITANAENSFGGKVTINAEGIFGTQFRENLTPQSDITASSELGAEFNGEVELNTPGIDPSSGINELPENLTDSSNQIAAGCSNKSGNSFIATGKGGIPQNPQEQFNINRSWSDIRNLSAFRKLNNNSEITSISNKLEIIEATAFIRNENGEIELVAAQNTPFNTTQVSNCSSLNT
ncbi:hypothetical protein NIES267_30280 [Calothrix parasitica NIES-267]|uniref:Filamentous haemagglutinin FhaB/tRNA nuclease CdiA-like TPS domain-containing protein n=1 Tax=Calothrix parasitica NIES-267 TaxID=1973488 RepID=A0A1Z4LQM4_9CYAN|nr:hypothetical protein NIES267_30280 [Calothrix parasitica NIES-267]